MVFLHKKHQERFGDSKAVIRSRKSKGRQHNAQNKKGKLTSNDLQNITEKTKDRETRAPLRIISI